MTIERCYSELRQLRTFDDRLDYLRLNGIVGRDTFGFDRYVNQKFYTSQAWRSVRQRVIYRDHGCDLGIPGFEIHVNVLIHHMNPMTVDDIVDGAEWILNPEYLITTTKDTHNFIHYGVDSPYPKVVLERTPDDTRLW